MLIANPEILLGIILTPQVVIFTQLPYYLHIHNIDKVFARLLLKYAENHTHTHTSTFIWPN